MNEEEAIASLERMFQEIRYTPSRAYGDMSKKEPCRVYDARIAAIEAAHPSLSSLDAEKLILRIWLELSQEYDQAPFSFASYMVMMDEWTNTLINAELDRLKDILATVEESLILN